MPDPDQAVAAGEAATGVLTLFLPWLFVGYGVATWTRGRRLRTVGAPLVRVAGDQGLRRALLALALGGLLLALLVPGGPAWQAALFAALLAAGTVLLSPAPGEGLVGTEGLAVGWEAWSWREVRRWRLSDRAVHADVGDRWLAVPLRAAEPPRVEALLAARLPDRRVW